MLFFLTSSFFLLLLCCSCLDVHKVSQIRKIKRFFIFFLIFVVHALTCIEPHMNISIRTLIKIIKFFLLSHFHLFHFFSSFSLLYFSFFCIRLRLGMHRVTCEQCHQHIEKNNEVIFLFSSPFLHFSSSSSPSINMLTCIEFDMSLNVNTLLKIFKLFLFSFLLLFYFSSSLKLKFSL